MPLASELLVSGASDACRIAVPCAFCRFSVDPDFESEYGVCVRVLYLVPRYWPSIGGAQLLSRELIRRIAGDHSVSVVTQSTSDDRDFVRSVASARPGEYQDGAIRVHRIGPTGRWGPCLHVLASLYGHVRPIRPVFAYLLDAAIRPQLGAIVEEFQPDVLHAMHVGLVYSSETGCRVARRFRVPYVWTPYAHIEPGSGWSGARFRRLYSMCDAIIAMTNREKRWYVECGAQADHVHVIPVGPMVSSEHDAERFRRQHGLGQAPVVLFLGQKLAYKGFKQMLEAAPAVWAAVPEARFVFIGPRTAASERCFAQHADRRIVELGAVPELVKNSALAACDVLCVPSTQESLGGVYLEAWAFRKPVVAADIDIAREVIASGRDGLLVAPESGAIAAGLLALLSNPSQRRQLGEAGYQKLRDRYDWKRLAGEMERLYLDLTRTRSVG